MAPNGDDTFVMTTAELAGSVIDGELGTDTLQLAGGGTFDLTTPSVFSSIEVVRGSDQHDTIVLDEQRLSGIDTIDGGDEPNTHWDELLLQGGAFDLSGKTLTGIDRLSLQTDGATITVSDADTAMLISGVVSQNDRLIAAGITFTAAELKALHQQGIDTIVDASGTHTNLAPSASNLDGDRFEAKAGQTVFVDMGQNAVLSEDDGRLALLKVEAPLGPAAPGRLRVDLTGPVTLEGGYAAGSTVKVSGVAVGMLWEASDGGLSVLFNSNATPDRVQAIVRSLTYTMADEIPETSVQQQILITLTDEGGRRSTSTVTIEQTITAEVPELVISHASVPELSEAGTLVGLLTGKAAGAGDAFMYQLLDSAGGRFTIENDRLLVASGAKLDFEQNPSHTIVVLATGPGGVTIRQSFTIGIEDVADEHIITPGSTPVRSDGNETLVGGRGRDVLDGGRGDDVLFGRQGHDRLTGGEGKDVFVFNTKPGRTNIDRISDFDVSDDTIYLDNKFFAKLGRKGSLAHPAKLSAKMFWKGAHAHDANDHIIYNSKNGVLYYDPDGTGTSAPVKIAILPKKLKILSHHDFYVV